MSVPPRCHCPGLGGMRVLQPLRDTFFLMILVLVGASDPVRGAGNCKAFTDPESDQWVRVEPLDKLEGFRAFITPFLLGEELRIRMEQGRGTPSFTHNLTITNVDGQTVPVAILDEEHPRPRVRILHIDAAGWPDGSYDITLRLIPERGADDSPDASPPSAPGTGDTDSPEDDGVTISLRTEVVRTTLASMPGMTHREELATWIQDHNRQHPIWGVLPTWTNLPAALRNGTQGDPYAGLRGFLLRAYVNPQLNRLQPYTVYVPETLDLDRPAPLLILLHGSGGDYRNLVADHASGQRFEEHPMLIANAGAFGHLEFRHLALNDVRGVIEDMQAKYNIDPDRIYCQGVSLGGRGVLELAARMPATFAGVSSQGVYGVMPLLLDPLWVAGVDPVRLQVEIRKDIRALLPRMHHVPVELFVQARDTVTPPVNARVIASWLHAHRRGIRGAAPVSIRTVDTGHNLTLPAYDWASTRAWFLEHTRRPMIAPPPLPGLVAQGPIWTIWQKPVLYVYDDTGESGATERLRLSAQRSASLAVNFGTHSFPVRAWGEVTEAERAEHHILLFQAAEGGSVLGGGDLPWPTDSETIRAAVAASTLRIALRPSPWSAAHRVLVVTVGGATPVNLNAIGLWDSAFRTDWVIGTVARGRVKLTAAGYYDASWEPLVDGYTLHDPRGPMVLRH